jgi:putative nucleotidyltransferase with HDIG domain
VIRSREALYVADWAKAASKTRKHYMIHDGGRIEEGRPEAPEDWEGSVRSALLAPMLYQGNVIGVLQLHSRVLDGYEEEDLDLLSGLANVAAIAIRNAQLVEEARLQAERLSSAFDGIIRTVSAAAEMRDPYTAGHQQRVARLASAIAETLGLDEQTIEGVRVASLVHDIGKLSVPAEILSRPGRLTETEFEIIKSHAESAFRILESIEFPWPIADTVYQHHERLDGSGYPRGLAGDEISLEARIIGVSDVVEAMASHRPYRPSLGLERALEEIEAQKSTKLDSQVVEACLALFRERGFDFGETNA